MGKVTVGLRRHLVTGSSLLLLLVACAQPEATPAPPTSPIPVTSRTSTPAPTPAPASILTSAPVPTPATWTRQFGSSNGDNANGVAVDRAGNVYVAGNTRGALPGQVAAGPPGYGDAYVQKYDSTGNIVWTRQFGTAAGDNAFGVAADSDGNVYVAGSTDGALPGQTSAGNRDAYVRKYDGTGNILWTRQFGTADHDLAIGVAVDGTGNVYIAGIAGSALPGQTSAGAKDAYLRKYDGAGSILWTRQFGSASGDDGYGVVADRAGNVYIAGYAAGALPGQTYAGGDWDAYVQKYDSAANILWTRQFGSPAYDFVDGVAVDGAGNVYVAGYTGGALTGQTPLGATDAYVRKYDGAGSILWTRQFGSADNDYINGLALDRGGNVYVAGYTTGALPGQTSLGAADAYVRKYDSEGNVLSTRQFGTAASDFAIAVAVDGSNIVYVAGSTDGALPGQASAGGRDAYVVVNLDLYSTHDHDH